MTVTPFPTEEFVAFIRERFPSARIDRTSNEHGTIWIEVRTDAGHAEIVATADGTIGATDIVRVDLEDETKNPFAPFDKKLDSVQAARDFIIRALS
jgi:hypothetical protein